MSLKAQLEAIIYAAEMPISLDQITPLVKESILAETPGIDDAEVKSRIRAALEELTADYSGSSHGIEIRQVAGGYRMSTKPEQHDVVRAFAKSLKPPIRLSLPALETLAVIAYKQPVTVPEISEIRGVDAGGVIATLLDRKLITTAGRKAVIGRPILYKTSKEFLLRFGLKDVSELPSMEEFEKLVAESFQGDLLLGENEAAPAAEAGSPNRDDAEATDSDLSADSADEEVRGARQQHHRLAMPAERLQKIIAAAGVASRRKAEELITSGRVQVNGKMITELGTKADPEQDHIRVDGKLLRGPERYSYIVLNKPKGYVTTVSDPEKRPTVMDLVRSVRGRVYPVGRLDWASEGLLLLTNDGELANALMKASSNVPKNLRRQSRRPTRGSKAGEAAARSLDRRERRPPGAHGSGPD